MALEKYTEKRKFGETPEPEAQIAEKSESRFVVQEHHASSLHYDFRLETTEEASGGAVVLKSWAVPKGLPEEKNQKRLAIATEDHPVSYINFEGEIPKGNYGAGQVRIWDKGGFEMIRRDEKLYEFRLNGEKAHGRFVLFKTAGYGNKNSWLLSRVD